jgi:hypothetical protein
LVGWLVGLFLLLPLGAYGIRETLRFASVSKSKTFGRTLGRVISPSQGRYLTQTQNKRTQTSMPRVVFEPTIPAFEREKTVHALDRAVAVIGIQCMGIQVILEITVL